MTSLKLGPLPDDKPVKVTVELSAPLYRDLVAYTEVLARERGQSVADPVRLIVPMLERFIATNRGFAKKRGQRNIKAMTGRYNQRLSLLTISTLSNRALSSNF